MFVKCLTEDVKSDVVDYYVNQDKTQSDIALIFEVSVRTIRRVLQERGVLFTRERFQCSANDKEILAVVQQKHHIIDPDTLDLALTRPAMSHGNVLAYLCNLDDEIFDRHIEAVKRARTMKVAEAANG